MSKLNHTPGQWHYVDYSPKFNGRFPMYDIRDDNGDCIAEVVHTESDARLMTAAPDMLDALIAQYHHTKNDHNVNGMNEATKSAIEFATGLPIEEVLK